MPPAPRPAPPPAPRTPRNPRPAPNPAPKTAPSTKVPNKKPTTAKPKPGGAKQPNRKEPETQSQRDRAEEMRELARQAAERQANFLAGVDGMFPTFFHQVSVVVQGSPACDLRRIWYLALAACAGRINASGVGDVVSRGLRGQAYTAQWNVTDKTCTITYSYSIAGAVANAIAELRNNDLSTPDISDPLTTRVLGAHGLGSRAICHGVDQFTVGGRVDDLHLNFKGGSFKANRGVPGFTTPPTVLNGTVYSIRPYNGKADVSRERKTQDSDTRPVYRVRAIAPANAVGQVQEYVIPADWGEFFLPDYGRVITTAETEDKRVQPPKPQVDGISRVHPLMSLVAPLINPGFSPVPNRLDLPEVQNLESQGLAAASVSITAPTTYPGKVNPAASVSSTGAAVPNAPAVLSQQAIDLAGVVGFAAAVAGSPVTGTP